MIIEAGAYRAELLPAPDPRVQEPYDGYLVVSPIDADGGTVWLAHRPDLDATAVAEVVTWATDRVIRLLDPSTAGEPDAWQDAPDGNRYAWCRPVELPSFAEAQFEV